MMCNNSLIKLYTCDGTVFKSYSSTDSQSLRSNEGAGSSLHFPEFIITCAKI